MSKRLGINLVLWWLVSLFAVSLVNAQITSSALSGRITDSAGNPVADATVEIIHVPSNSTKTVTTDTDGRYSTRGLRVGGPFKVTATKEGNKPAVKEEVFLALAEDTTVNLQLETDVAQLEGMSVVASGQSLVFQQDNKGLSTNIGRQEIEAFPSIARSIQDYVRLDPRITQTDKERGEISAVGQNSRYNATTIDGVPTSDQFGLEANGLPSQSFSQPISIDTVEEFNVSTANYDVTNARSVGASINAVTKSGTNDFHGSLYYLYRDNDMVGENENGQEFTGFNKQDVKGFTLGGPIVKDTLFFFLGYEEFKRTAPAPDVGVVGSGASTETTVTQAQLDQIIDIATNQYHFNPGSFGSLSGVDNTDQKIIGKIDWNINDAHRTSFRYNKIDSSVPVLGNLSKTALSLSTNWYQKDYNFENYVVSFYDDWTDNFSSEAFVSYSEYSNRSPLFGDPLPQVRINVDSQSAVFLGTDRSRAANKLDVKTTTAFWAGNWSLGDHALKFGFDYNKMSVFNLFLQDYFGNYTFASVNDFAAGKYSNFQLNKPNNGELNSVAADWDLKNYGLFLQDTWQVTSNLSTQFGVRVDIPDVGTEPAYNSAFEATYGFRNNATVDGNKAVEPRVSFNYTFDTERPTQLRGGVGLFTGSALGVWLSNSYSSTGQTFTSYFKTNGTGFTADPYSQPTPSGSSILTLNALDPNFKQPTVWKTNIAVDHELPWWGLVASAEYLYLNVQDAIYFKHLNLGAPTGTLPDGRDVFWNSLDPTKFANPLRPTATARGNANAKFGDVLLLTNTDQGHASSATLSLEKPFKDDWYAKLSFTRGRSTEINPGTSSVALSNWQNMQVYNANEEVANTANYEVKNRVTLALSWRHDFFEDLTTSVSAFYEGRAGRPYSYTFSNDANGDRITGNDLFYVPAGLEDVMISDAAQAQAFWDYVNNNDYLSSHKGQVVGRNAVRAPWINSLDVRFSQQVPGFWRDAKGEVTVDILNFLNLLNKDWGHIDEVAFPGGLGVAQFAGVDPKTGKYIYKFPQSPAALSRRDVAGESRWAIQVGLRYEF